MRRAHISVIGLSDSATFLRQFIPYLSKSLIKSVPNLFVNEIKTKKYFPTHNLKFVVSLPEVAPGY